MPNDDIVAPHDCDLDYELLAAALLGPLGVQRHAVWS